MKVSYLNLRKIIRETILNEVAPPGKEKQVKSIKNAVKSGKINKTYVDNSGKRKRTNPWAIAWSQYGKDENES